MEDAMRKLAVFGAAIGAAAAIPLGLAMAGVPAQTKPGTPISGIPVGLEGIPPVRIAAADTDADGVALLGWDRKPGTKGVVVFIADRAKLKAPVMLKIYSGRSERVSAPIKPGKGAGYALDAAGEKLVVEPFYGVRSTRQQVRVTVMRVATAEGK
jgi:hypothetical protein